MWYDLVMASRNLKILFVLLVLLSLVVSGVNYFRLSKFITTSQFFNSENQVKATKDANNPVLSYGTDPKSTKHIAGNCVIKDQSNNALVFYYKNYLINSKPVSKIGFAKTSDNIHFQTVSDNILSPGTENEWDGGSVEVHPGCIIQRQDGTYYMYYSGFKVGAPDFYSNGNGGIGLATSKDLVTWVKYPKNPILKPDTATAWESEGVFEPSVIFSGNEYGAEDSFKMWYGGNGKDNRMSIGYAESHDGTNWKKYQSNPVISYSGESNKFDSYTIEVHDVIHVNNQYIIAYEAAEQKFPSPFRIGLASSTDGKNWHKSPYNPILEGGMVGSWDAMGAYHPSIVVENDKILMYYVGLNSHYDHQIGVAEINPFYFYHITD